MQDQRIPTVVDDAQIEGTVLGLLLTDEAVMWSVEQMARELGDEVAARDSLARLHALGLVHRLDGFVFASRAAGRAVGLALA